MQLSSASIEQKYPEPAKRSVLISQSNYIPWKGYFDAINLVDEVILYDDVQFTRRDWRNRNQIKTPQGLQWLTIPVEVKGKYTQKILETRISDPNWPVDHWKTLHHVYSKAPFYKEIKIWLEPLFLETNATYLSEVNARFIRAINEYLGIKTKIRSSSEFDLVEGRTERLADICVQVEAAAYVTGPAAKSYLDEIAFASNGVQVFYLDYSDYPPYPQLHGDFVHSVSILDMLFNLGPNTREFMKTFGSDRWARMTEGRN